MIEERAELASAMAAVTGHIRAIKPSLPSSDLAADRLIVEDLGLDSLDLAELGQRLRDDFGPVDLMPWLGQAVSGGGTVGSLAEVLAGAAAAGVPAAPTPDPDRAPHAGAHPEERP